MGVDEHCIGELVGRAGELRQHEHAVAVDVRGGVLLGDQVHPVAERRDEHDVAGSVERHQVVVGERLVQVVDDREPDRAEPAVDLTDEPLDLGPLVLVVLDRLTGRRGHLDHHVTSGVEPLVLEQLGRTP